MFLKIFELYAGLNYIKLYIKFTVQLFRIIINRAMIFQKSLLHPRHCIFIFNWKTLGKVKGIN